MTRTITTRLTASLVSRTGSMMPRLRTAARLTWHLTRPTTMTRWPRAARRASLMRPRPSAAASMALDDADCYDTLGCVFWQARLDEARRGPPRHRLAPDDAADHEKIGTFCPEWSAERLRARAAAWPTWKPEPPDVALYLAGGGPMTQKRITPTTTPDTDTARNLAGGRLDEARRGSRATDWHRQRTTHTLALVLTGVLGWMSDASSRHTESPASPATTATATLAGALAEAERRQGARWHPTRRYSARWRSCLLGEAR